MYIPGNYKLDKNKIKQIIEILHLDKDSIKSLKKNIKNTKSTLKYGDTQLAVVISIEPLLIACYSDEFDHVLIYEYPIELVHMYSLEVGSYLVTSNSYWPKECFEFADDIIIGKACSYDWRDIITFIPLFICIKTQEINCYYTNFNDEIKIHLEELIKEYKEKKPNQYRKGFKTLIKY